MRSAALAGFRADTGQLRGRPFADAALEDRQRHRAIAQNFVELAQVEPGTERLLRFLAGAKPGEVADLVAAGLAGRSTVTLDLALDAALREAGGPHHVIDRLLAAPA